MAFESLSDRFQHVFKKLRGQTRLSESNMDEMLKEIRVALLEADVNFKVVKSFVSDIKEKAVGQDVYDKVNPSQMVVKIVHDEMCNLLGEDQSDLNLHNGLSIIMLVGLQGTGKTTTAGKLSKLLMKRGKKVMLAALDVYRPAAIDQLRTIATEVGADFFTKPGKPSELCLQARDEALAKGEDVLIIDTAGRLQIDETLMQELQDINHAVHPDEVLLLVDAASGQDAVNVAKAFNSSLHLTGVVLSKLDGDAKGGAALSIKYLTGLPIKFAATGEKMDDIEQFHPDRMADRILGMGDIVTLVEKAKDAIDEKTAEKEAKKMMDGEFTLEDMLRQMKMVRRLGSLGSIAKLIPGMPKLTDEQKATAEKEMKIFESVINSMTPYERRHPETLRFSHKNRIAKGCGLDNGAVNKVLRKFEQSKQAMKQLKQYAKSGKGMGGFGGFGR